ncbi:MAG TPA: YicC/YloC family endoribonuclease [Methylophilaceae bacterium]|nr:YicC/YloC family endoribonuclease [Methylophilaceae bacterium]
MIFSMTGFASLEREVGAGVLVLELRSVNHRYLELQLKLDEHLRGFEPLIRELIATRLGRGKVECRMSLMSRNDDHRAATLDAQALQQLAMLSAQVKQTFPDSAPLSVADILRWPGVVASGESHAEELEEDVRAGLTHALQDMTDARAREGEKLALLVLERLDEVEHQVAGVKPLIPQQVKAFQERMLGKLRETLKTVDEERVAQELVMFSQRVDVDEELTRLGAHITEVRRILASGGAVGKRLDFLMQELNREANTLGSKSVSTEVSQASMALKVLIEQMREQIQNIE